MNSAIVAVVDPMLEKAECEKHKLDRMPQYRVLLHNDDYIEAEYVVKTLKELLAFDETRAIIVMVEADETEVALVLVTHKERAELIEEQFRSKGLKITIEPEDS